MRMTLNLGRLRINPVLLAAALLVAALGMQHVQCGPCVAGKARGEVERGSRGLGEVDGGEDGSRWEHDDTFHQNTCHLEFGANVAGG